MDCSYESLRVDMGVIVGAGELGYCNQCLILEQKIKTIECTCSGLPHGSEQERNGFKLLEGQFEVLKGRNQELEEQMRRIENSSCNEENEEEDGVLQLMIENNVLECEKRKAESDVEYWKSKCNELQLTMAKLDKNLVSKAGDRISTQLLCGLRDTEELHQVKGLQDECNHLAQKMDLQEVDEMQNKDANPFLFHGEIGSLQSQDSGAIIFV